MLWCLDSDTDILARARPFSYFNSICYIRLTYRNELRNLSFKNLDRWSHEGILRSVLHVNEAESKFPVVELGTVGRVAYGLQKSPANRPSTNPRPYLRVANVQRWRLDLGEIKMIDVPDRDMPAYRLEDGDILLCEGNSAELVGRGAIWRNEIPECIHQNHVLRARMDTSKVVPEFTLAVINSPYGQAYFRSKAKRTTNLASINSKEVSRFSLPLPPVDEQRSLVNAWFQEQQVAEGLRRRATAARAATWKNFEAVVYDVDRMKPFDADSPAELCDHLLTNDVCVPPRGLGQTTPGREIWGSMPFSGHSLRDESAGLPASR